MEEQMYVWQTARLYIAKAETVEEARSLAIKTARQSGAVEDVDHIRVNPPTIYTGAVAFQIAPDHDGVGIYEEARPAFRAG